MTEEELDRLLSPTNASPNAAKIRRAALAASLGALPRSSRPYTRIASGVAMLLVGFALGWWGKPQPEPRSPEQIEVPAVQVAAPALTQPPSESKPDGLYTAVDLDKLETEAEIADAPTAAKLYRKAGDIYLGQSDIAAATRCYRLHLNELGHDGLARKDDDSWLLVSLKTSTRQEIEP